MKTVLLTITVAFILMGCQSNPTSPQSKQSIQIHEYDHIQKETDGSYSVVIDGKVKYTELKYARSLFCSTKILMLNKHNKKKIIKARLVPFFCDDTGDEAVYKYRAVKKHKKIEIYLDILSEPFDKDRKNMHLASIPTSKADKVFFNNHRDHYVKNIDTTCRNLESVYYQKEGKYGVLGKITYKWDKKIGDIYGFKIGSGEAKYDALHVVDCLVKVEKNGLVGYLEHTDIKYKDIDVYKNGLARFTLPDGCSGYVTSGDKREFYDE